MPDVGLMRSGAGRGAVQGVLPVGALRAVPAGLRLLHPARPLQAGRGRQGRLHHLRAAPQGGHSYIHTVDMFIYGYLKL